MVAPRSSRGGVIDPDSLNAFHVIALIVLLPMIVLVLLLVLQGRKRTRTTIKDSVVLQDNLEALVTNRTDELARSETRSRNLVSQVIAAQGIERKRITYEVHDGLTQTAIATYQHCQAFVTKYHHLIQEGIVLTPEMIASYHDDLDELVSLAKQTIVDSRNFIEDLRPPILDDYGLVAATAQRCSALREKGWDILLTIHQPLHPNPQRTTPEIENTVYRVLQEALTNISKHAGACRVHVTLDLDNRGSHGLPYPRVLLIVTDNGLGFDPNNPENHTTTGPGQRIGLRAMHERVTLMGGTFTIESTPGEGTTIVAAIPPRHDDEPDEGPDQSFPEEA